MNNDSIKFNEETKDHSENEVLRRYERSRRPPEYFDDRVNISEHEIISAENAVNDQNWKQAMDDEMESMRKNNVFELVPRPPNTKILNSRWIFKTKLTDGNITYKTRLVAQGHTQPKGQDYDEILYITTLFSTTHANGTDPVLFV